MRRWSAARRSTSCCSTRPGTLTEGKPKVVAVVAATADGEDDVLRLAASVEQLSEHPLAQAIVDAAREHETCRSIRLTDFENLAGKGVRATHRRHAT